MKIKVERLGDSEIVIIDGLLALGIDRIKAHTLVYLNSHPSCLATEIERATGLHQPEVSIAMKQLREKGWVSEKNKPKKGKGRPNKIYTLKVGFNTILAELETSVQKKAAGTQASIARLKMLVN